MRWSTQAEALAHVAVLGRVLRSQRRAVASVGLDSKGDPVLLRLDRETVVRELLDGRPYVVSDSSAPVRALNNSGVLTPLLPGDVVSYEGVRFYVVARAGLVPVAGAATKTMEPEPAYASSGPAPDWSGWNGLTPQNSGRGVKLQRHDGETGYIRLFNHLIFGEAGSRPYDLVSPSTSGTTLSGPTAHHEKRCGSISIRGGEPR